MIDKHFVGSFGLIGAEQIFRPTIWDRYGGDDFKACGNFGAWYG
jgi:hypothetical protein